MINTNSRSKELHSVSGHFDRREKSPQYYVYIFNTQIQKFLDFFY